MSPPQLQFIDLSTRDPQGAEKAFVSAELAAQVPSDSSTRYRDSAKVVRLHALPRPVAIGAEAARWQLFLGSLTARVVEGSVPAVQRDTLLSIWERARSRQPALRRPAVGFSTDGSLQASWSFKDSPKTLTIEILRDGGVEWFFRDNMIGRTEGSGEEPERELPDSAIELLSANFLR
jgi:hypothetical protein